jgi:hypothetical protein
MSGKTHYTSGQMGKGNEGFNKTLEKINKGDKGLLKGTSGLGTHLKVQRNPRNKDVNSSFKAGWENPKNTA